MEMSNLSSTHQFDVIIVGSGGAGLSLALSLPHHFNIAVLAKSTLTDASTYYAQGGVAAVLDETDSIQQHIDDPIIKVHIYVNLMQSNKPLKAANLLSISCLIMACSSL